MGKAEFFHVALYIRLSREDGDKEESDSVGNQRKLLAEFISNMQNAKVYDTYVDDGYTGTSFDRPGFQRMITDIEEGKVNCVAVKDLSRFGRDYIDTGRYLERVFPELGVRFISVSDGIDSIRQAYDMLLPIKNIFNEQYARDISKKIHATIKSKQKAGEFIGAFASYGYKKSPTDKNKLVIDEYAAEIVKQVFCLFTGGMGKQAIARHLNEEGILCPSEYKLAKGENYRNCNRLGNASCWTYSTIHAMLKNEMYIGNMVQGKKRQQMRSRQKPVEKENWIVIKDTHEPIIDPETWEQAQSLLAKKKSATCLGTTENIFAGFIKCGDCGRAMVQNGWKRADGSRNYCFYCGTYKRQGKIHCTPHALPLLMLERIIKDDLRTVIQNVRDLQCIVKKQLSLCKPAEEPTGKEVIRAEGELKRVQKLKKSAYEDYKEGLISKEEFLAYREDYLKKEELYKNQLKIFGEKKQSHAAQTMSEFPWIKRLLEQKDIENLDRELIMELVDQILVYENHKIRICYNFGGEWEGLFSNAYLWNG